MDRAVDEVVRSFESNTLSTKSPTKVLFADKRYKAIDFSEKNFKEIQGTASTTPRIAALDAGNAELLGAPNFSLQFFRFSCVVFRDNKRVDAGIKNAEAYCLAQAKAEGGRIIYSVEIFPKNEAGNFLAKKFSFDSMDATLGSGIFRAEISRACGAARRCIEWDFAAHAAGKMSEKDIVLIDGSLQTGLSGEKEHADSAFVAAKSSGAIFCGLAKTSRLFTDAGTPAASGVFSLARHAKITGAWDYHPVAEVSCESHRADIHFVRLHEESRHAFRFEIFDGQKEHASDALSALAKNSCDRAFVGYPYALVAAHMAAKIRPEEIASERAIILSRAGKSAREIEDGASAFNAHGILDKI